MKEKKGGFIQMKEKKGGFMWYYDGYEIEVSGVTVLNEEKIKILKIITPYFDQYGDIIEIELKKIYKNGRLIGAFLWYGHYGIRARCLRANYRKWDYRSFREILYTMLENIVNLELLALELEG